MRRAGRNRGRVLLVGLPNRSFVHRAIPDDQVKQHADQRDEQHEQEPQGLGAAGQIRTAELQPITIMTLRLSKETRDQQHDHKWGGWGSNPRPADYESARLPVAQVRQRPDLGI